MSLQIDLRVGWRHLFLVSAIISYLALCFFLLFSAFAQAQTRCQSLDAELASIDAAGLSHSVHDGEALDKARAIYAAAPPASPEPEADRLLIVRLPNGGVGLAFIHRDTVCVRALVGPERAPLLLRVLLGDAA